MKDRDELHVVQEGKSSRNRPCGATGPSPGFVTASSEKKMRSIFETAYMYKHDLLS